LVWKLPSGQTVERSSFMADCARAIRGMVSAAAAEAPIVTNLRLVVIMTRFSLSFRHFVSRTQRSTK
jgi:hypothetical protein